MGIIIHVPHGSRTIPAAARAGIVLTDSELRHELNVMTDSFTIDMAQRVAVAFPNQNVEVVAASVSRLVVDVERFPDEREEMNTVGMGAIYTHTHDLNLLRSPGADHGSLLSRYYYPHAQRMEDAVTRHLHSDNSVTIVDLHSYPTQRQPYEQSSIDAPRPPVCLGVDEFHTHQDQLRLAQEAFSGMQVGINSPFAGAYVPLSRYKKNPEVNSLMIELRRDQYMDEESMTLHLGFANCADNLIRLIDSLVSCSND